MCFGFFLVLVFCTDCTTKRPRETAPKTPDQVDVSRIPNDTILETNQALKLENGIYYLQSKPFSGFIKSTYETGRLQSIGSYYEGKQHGITRTFYASGQLRDVRNYRANFSYGRQLGFWPNGKQKFDFIYINDKREGLQKQWYESGKRYAFLTFADDKEQGMQRAWRENGKPYINYEVKDGIRYGLQKSALCYTLREGKLK